MYGAVRSNTRRPDFLCGFGPVFSWTLFCHSYQLCRLLGGAGTVPAPFLSYYCLLAHVAISRWLTSHCRVVFLFTPQTP